jgi:YbgC/YbaW family acyl-CoA thioester hydrolase
MLYWIFQSYYRKNQKPKAQLLDRVKMTQSVSFKDLDIYQHVNNARYLNKYEIARWHFCIQTGLTKFLLEQRIQFIVVGAELSYIKELKWREKFQIHTQLVGADDKYVYFEQTMHSNGKIKNHGMFKVLFLQKKNKLSPAEIFQMMGVNTPPPQLPAHFEAWQKTIQEKQQYTKSLA